MNSTIEQDLIELHVETLAPPEPMTKILTALAALADHQLLKVYHRREPFPLYEKLNENGWCHHCVKHSEDQYQIFIFRSEYQKKFSFLFDGHTR